MKFIHKIKSYLPLGIQDLFDLYILRYQRNNAPDSGTQKLLMLNYKTFAQNNQLFSFDEIGFCGYSGSTEDGILLYIFALIGTTNHLFVDIGAGGVGASNTANLVINHGWHGLQIDGNQEALRKAQSIYAKTPSVKHFPPKAVSAFVTTENINSIIQSNGFNGVVDLVSIDIDGNDYWIWETLDCVQPRVVIAEYQPAIKAGHAWATPYDPKFNHRDYAINQSSDDVIYAGASLSALNKLAKKKGYRLVGCNVHGFNAFFVKDNVGEDMLPEVSVESCLTNPRAVMMQAKYEDLLADLEWAKI